MVQVANLVDNPAAKLTAQEIIDRVRRAETGFSALHRPWLHDSSPLTVRFCCDS